MASFFEINNTPENIRRARRNAKEVQKKSPIVECPRLNLAPFSRPPQVIFENVVLGTSCTRELEIFNPSDQIQRITLGRALPPGLIICLSGEWLIVEPQTCYCLSLIWTPTQPTACRETLRFSNENRGRYDVILVLKSIMSVKGKEKQSKSFKISPGKMKKNSPKHKRSPAAIYKKKVDIVYNTTVRKSVHVVETTENVWDQSNKENLYYQYTADSNERDSRCPFDSPMNIDFNTTEIFSNMKRSQPQEPILHETYDKNFDLSAKDFPIHHTVLKPSNKLNNQSTGDIFDNVTFTPVKSLAPNMDKLKQSPNDIFDNVAFTPVKSLAPNMDKLKQGPKIILSLNSESDDSFDLQSSIKKNDTNSIICVTSSQQTNIKNNWLQLQTHVQLDDYNSAQNKKIPNTSSPKEMHSPNFSINTELSRISDLSFMPNRCSTEKKMQIKTSDMHDINDDKHFDNKPNSDTFTKESPYSIKEQPHITQMYMEQRPPHFFMREQHPKLCRQNLLREYEAREAYFLEKQDRNFLTPNQYERNVWYHNKSPPRSMTPPPLQSIPEESSQLTDTRVLDKTTDRATTTFIINRTFDKLPEKSFSGGINTWSKKAVTVEPELWKVPTSKPKKSLKPNTIIKLDTSGRASTINDNISNVLDVSKGNLTQNLSFNHFGNVYSQSLTVDPFLSTSYFYDEESVDKFEVEFKRWLNYILTPPSDLESNIEQKIDKAWIENRNKEIPTAPTKEQVCSSYHNSHRLESLRRAARALLKAPEIGVVIEKLNAQIEKKLIAIRADRNLHLDVGLQKTIMELLLSYNPLWLRIGLEAIYGIVLPLRSNSDIEGLTVFIIQRLFRNPYLKNKNSKSNAPNMLLPAYMEAMKKFTLKRFFLLVFFLDQAKQKKLIPHDPCLFCRNAECKESRDIIIRFTREVIAGIGDITKHLRPLGYVVTHKQTYLDEYKYGVHNIAVDLRDGVRLTKVMEIILMKDGLLHQLRTPAHSRLQKIHNVQVAFNALKAANFTIVGDISAKDIADGHREKTLSLLWQLIHVFRAPLFYRAANVIQTWWRKKFEVIMQKRKQEEERRLQHYVKVTIVIQKYCRMWLCKRRLYRMKMSVLKIEKWYRNIKMIREAKFELYKLKVAREELRQRSAIVIQSVFRRWMCMKQHQKDVQSVVFVQSLCRRFILRKRFLLLKRMTTYIQQKFRGKLLMRKQMQEFLHIKKLVTLIQSTYRMFVQRRLYLQMKKAVQIVEERYEALTKMRTDQKLYQKLKHSTILIQAQFRGWKTRKEYQNKRDLIIKLQLRIKAHQLMKSERELFVRKKVAAILIQRYWRSYCLMKQSRSDFMSKRNAAIVIQNYYRSYKLMKRYKIEYIQLKKAAVTLQVHYRSLLAMRKQREEFLQLRNATLVIQKYYRANILMRSCKDEYNKLRNAALTIQQRRRAQVFMKMERGLYIQMRESCMKIQTAYRAYVAGKKQRLEFLTQKKAALTIQNWYRSCKKGQLVKCEYEKTKHACVSIQKFYRAFKIGKKQRQEYVRIRTATIKIQTYYRSYVEMKSIRNQYIALKTATVTIQRYFKAYLKSKKQREEYLKLRSAVTFIQNFYRRYKEAKFIRQRYCELRNMTIIIQAKYRAISTMRKERERFIKLKSSTICIQQRYRALIAMRIERNKYIQVRKAVIIVQERIRAYVAMKVQRQKYLKLRSSCIMIQRYYRAVVLRRQAKERFLQMKYSAIILQRRYRALVSMRTCRQSFTNMKSAVLLIQRKFRAQKMMLEQKTKFRAIFKACVAIQRFYRAYSEGKKQRMEYLIVRRNVVRIQSAVRMFIQYRRFQKINCAVKVIQTYYRSYKLGKMERKKYNQLRKATVKLQSFIRCYIQRKKYLRIRASILAIQASIRFMRQKAIRDAQRKDAAICIQKHVRRYLQQSRYTKYRRSALVLQRFWRGVLITRMIRCNFLQKRSFIIRLQAIVRGYVVRKKMEIIRAILLKVKEKERRNSAASKIQALFRGHRVRVQLSCTHAEAMRRRWREGALQSTQASMAERNQEAIIVLENISDIETVIRAFKSLELLTEVFPMMYVDNACFVAHHVFEYMLGLNRSISSVEVLKSASAVLVNLARYKITGPKIYDREHVLHILKFMFRFSGSEALVFCVMATYLWLFAKYDQVRKDLTEFLKTPENLRLLTSIKQNIERLQRMAKNSARQSLTPKISRMVSRTKKSISLPALEPDYGIVKAGHPRYFVDPDQAINCLFNTYLE